MTEAGVTSSTRREIRRLRELLPESTELWLGGRGTGLLRALPSGVNVASSLNDIDTLVAGARAQK